MPFIALYYEWDAFNDEETRQTYIDLIWEREFEFDEDDAENF